MHELQFTNEKSRVGNGYCSVHSAAQRYCDPAAGRNPVGATVLRVVAPEQFHRIAWTFEPIAHAAGFGVPFLLSQRIQPEGIGICVVLAARVRVALLHNPADEDVGKLILRFAVPLYRGAAQPSRGDTGMVKRRQFVTIRNAEPILRLGVPPIRRIDPLRAVHCDVVVAAARGANRR